jgi:predicted TPR repeat methyltransferase
MNEAIAHHQAGRLHEAELIYRRVLETSPEEANAWHLLGMIAHAAGQFDDAAKLVGHACRLQPAVWAYRHNLAEVHRAAGRHEQAAIDYSAALEIDEAQAKSHVGLGSVLEALNRFDEAALHYRRALELDAASAAAHYGLAALLADAGELPAAARHASRAVELSPQDADARHRYGVLLSMLGDLPATVEQFRAAADLRPSLSYHLGATLGKLAAQEEALDFFARAMLAAPESGEPYLLAGRALFELGRRPEAVETFRRATQLMPETWHVWHDFALVLEAEGHSSEAAEAFAKAGQLGMTDEAQLHLAAMGKTQAPATAPAAYVRRLFDDYAGKFDQSLVGLLQYQTPQLLVQAVRAVTDGSPDVARWNIIDLGCGTGLCGKLLRPLAKRLIGVDLSPRMIEQASKSGAYDQLILGDVVETLLAHRDAFDLITAADVFVYVGDLGPVFRAAAGSLRAGGFFAFSVEHCEGNAYQIGPSRRYAHPPDYVRRLAEENGFTVRSFNPATLRLEKGQKVEGRLVVLQA